MDHVKQGFKSLLDLFQASSAEKCKPDKSLNFLCLGQVKMTRVMLHRRPKSVNRIISTVTKNPQTTVPYQNDLSDQKIENINLILNG